MFKVPERFRFTQAGHRVSSTAIFGNNGLFILPTSLRCIASDGEGWEHVSASHVNRCPTWQEMCRVKDLFWGEEDVVMQLHPAKSVWVNQHPYCLHLWRPAEKGVHIPLPPTWMVGVVGMTPEQTRLAVKAEKI